MKKNVASQVVGCQGVTASDGSAFTGSVTVYVTGDGGTQAVGSVGSGACTHEGNGFHTYAPAQAETNYDHVAFTFVGTGMVPVTVQLYPTFPQTGDAFARLGAPAGASVSADIAEVKSETAAIVADTDELQADDVPGLIAALNDLSAAEVNAEVAAALADINLDHLVGTASGIPAVPAGTYLDQIMDDGTATYDRTTDSLQAIRDRGDAAWTTGAGGSPPDLLQSTTIATLASQTEFTLTAGSADDDAYNGALVVVTDQSTVEQKAVGIVLDYVGSTKTVTLDADPGIFTMAVGDDIVILAVSPAASAPSAAAIAAAVLEEALAGHTTAGTLGKAIADIETDATAILADTGTDGVVVAADSKTGYSISGTLTTLDALDTAQNAQHAQTQSDIAAVPTVSEIWAGITAAAGRFIADHTLRRSFASAAASGDGDAKSFRSLLGAVAKLVNKVSISGTTLTVTEADDTTSLGTQTLTTDAAAEPITGADTT